MTTDVVTAESLQAGITELSRAYGEWTYDIPLPHGVWTRGNLGRPHKRLGRVLQIASDMCRKPIESCRVLDLACLDGIFSVEFALHGAEVVGIEIREANIRKAEFCRDALGLDRLRFVQDDVRKISREKYGEFDLVLCSGILYHLQAEEAFRLIEDIHSMVTDVAIVDTHVSLNPAATATYKGRMYHGHLQPEHDPGESEERKLAKLWASADNLTSFWLSRPSLINCLSDAGFSSVYECYGPAYVDPEAGAEQGDRCTFVGLKRGAVECRTSPATNGLDERWPEGSLTYAGRSTVKKAVRGIRERLRARATKTGR